VGGAAPGGRSTFRDVGVGGYSLSVVALDSLRPSLFIRPSSSAEPREGTLPYRRCCSSYDVITSSAKRGPLVSPPSTCLSKPWASG